MPRFFRWRVLAVAAMAAGCTGGAGESPATGMSPAAAAMASVVFTNGRVYTLDANQPWAEAVAVRGAEIAYVGDASSVTALVGDDTEVIDLAGRMLLPLVYADDDVAGTDAGGLAPARAAGDLLAAIEATLGADGADGADGEAVPRTVAEAIRAHTLEQARERGMERTAGSITRGKQADLVVLEANLFDVRFDDIDAIAVQLAMTDGRIVHRDGV